MTNMLPETPHPTTPAANLSRSDGTALRARLLDLTALLLLLTITAVLYLLIGPSSGMVTGTATGLYTTYRRTPPSSTAPRPPDQEPQ